MDRGKRAIKTPRRFENYEAPSSTQSRNILKVKLKQKARTPIQSEESKPTSNATNQTEKTPQPSVLTPVTPQSPLSSSEHSSPSKSPLPPPPVLPPAPIAPPLQESGPTPAKQRHTLRQPHPKQFYPRPAKLELKHEPQSPAPHPPTQHTPKQTAQPRQTPPPARPHRDNKHDNNQNHKDHSLHNNSVTNAQSNSHANHSSSNHNSSSHKSTPSSVNFAATPHYRRLSMRNRPRPVPAVFDDIIPNTLLPFWDARTAAEVHEDDNVKELVHCICGIDQESGLMVQCETCLTWQHAVCLGLGETESEVPDGYTCSACAEPKDVRESMKYVYDQEWLSKGKMKRFASDKKQISSESMSKLKRTNELIERVLLLKKLIHSYKLKTKILEADDNDAKLKMFRHIWIEPDQPLGASDLRLDGDPTADNCRANLKAHLKQLEDHISGQLAIIEIEVTSIEETAVRANPEVETPSLESLKSDLLCMKGIVNQRVR